MHCRARLATVRHGLTEKEVDALAAAAHGFVGADLAALCDEAAMAALRRVIASKQHVPSVLRSPPLQPPQPPQHASLDQQHPAGPNLQLAARGQQPSDTGSQISGSEQGQQRQVAYPSAESGAEGIEQQAQDAACHSSRGESVRPESESDSSLVPANVASVAQTARPGDSAAAGQPLHAAADAHDTSRQHRMSQPEAALNCNPGGHRHGQSALQLTLADFRVAETRVRPSAMREVALEVPDPAVMKTECPSER